MPSKWKPIPEFPGYEVSDRGEVINARGHHLTQSPTYYGDPTVGMMRDGVQLRRSVKVLVARAFVEGRTDVFDTPIVLDGNRENLLAGNIKWRPRWFAIMYAKQWDRLDQWWYAGPVVDLSTGNRYAHILDAGIHTGSLIHDIRTGMMNRTRVFPEGGEFIFE